MREQTPNPSLIIPSEPEHNPADRTDSPLAALNGPGRLLVQLSPSRPWDGQTISLAGFQRP